MQNLNEGESWTGTYLFRNISSEEFSDSLVVQSTIYNTTYRTSELGSKKNKKHPHPARKTTFTITVNSQDKAGLNDVKVFCEPANSSGAIL